MTSRRRPTFHRSNGPYQPVGFIGGEYCVKCGQDWPCSASEEQPLTRIGVLYHGGSKIYAFDTDLPVKLGDEVLLPGRFPGESGLGAVVEFGTRYDGPVKRIRAIITDETVKRLNELTRQVCSS